MPATKASTESLHINFSILRVDSLCQLRQGNGEFVSTARNPDVVHARFGKFGRPRTQRCSRTTFTRPVGTKFPEMNEENRAKTSSCCWECFLSRCGKAPEHVRKTSQEECLYSTERMRVIGLQSSLKQSLKEEFLKCPVQPTTNRNGFAGLRAMWFVNAVIF